ncbi:MAG: acetyl-CoA carboxylase carboxyltransferase subunit alpha/beta [Actinomycetota bacterium]|nr:acetyl-CoA carboxylase carboxyltransferase subunit alpha/beta [Actinomycetota bacterium]
MEEAPSQAHDIIDPGSFRWLADDLQSRDPLRWPGYRDSLQRASERAATDESVVTGAATIEGHEVELALFNFSFMGGSMGEVGGERLARSMERAGSRRVPFILRTETGGARMQEGMRSLIQMPKVVAARVMLAEAHQPMIAVLGHPTTGGVLASLASLADITLAEQQATIGFAGPRVAEHVTGQPLPPGSHTATSGLDHGMFDDVVSAETLRSRVAVALVCLAPDDPQPDLQRPVEADGGVADPWTAVETARRHKDVDPTEAVEASFELRGDRAGAPADELRCWIARGSGRRFLLMDTSGEPLRPSGFRKALRCIEVAERLHLPVVTLVDTPGADPSASSEGEGVAWLIARLTHKMLTASVPVLSIVTGEGGSGGALAFATGDVLVAYEASIFSVIGPEAAAEILWKDPARAPEAARSLRLTSHDLRELGIADAVVAGDPTTASLREVVPYHLDRLSGVYADDPDPSRRRRARWRNTW